MAEYDGVYVFRPADGKGVPCHFDDGDGKMYQNAYCQQDFDAQHDAEGAVEWVVQYRQVAVVHHRETRPVCKTERTSISKNTPPTKAIAQ